MLACRVAFSTGTSAEVTISISSRLGARRARRVRCDPLGEHIADKAGRRAPVLLGGALKGFTKRGLDPHRDAVCLFPRLHTGNIGRQSPPRNAPEGGQFRSATP